MKKIMMGTMLALLFTGQTAIAQEDIHGFPKKRSFSKIEKEQINLLKCAKTVVQKKHGGLEAPVLIHDLLLKGMVDGALTDDTLELKELTKECHDLRRNYSAVSEKEIDRIEMAKTIWSLEKKSPESKKISNLIFDLYRKEKVLCKGTLVEGEASLFVGANVGLTSLKCLQSDGVVRNYAGVNLGLLLVSVSGAVGGSSFRVFADTAEDVDLNQVVFHLYNFKEADLEGYDTPLKNEKGIGLLRVRNSKGQVVGFKVGAKFSMIEFHRSIGVRFFNGAPRWQILLDQLK